MKKKIMIMIATICCCIGSLNMSIVPAHASDDKHACPVGTPKEFYDLLTDNPYWLDISFASTHKKGSSVGCNGVEHYYFMSNKPIVVEHVVAVDGSDAYIIDGYSTQILLGRTGTDDAPTWRKNFTKNNVFTYSDVYTYVTNHDIATKEGDIAFPVPPAPVDPVKPDVSLGEEWWTVILTRIIPLVPGIVVVIGGMVLLILLLRYLRRSVKSSMV